MAGRVALHAELSAGRGIDAAHVADAVRHDLAVVLEERLGRADDLRSQSMRALPVTRSRWMKNFASPAGPRLGLRTRLVRRLVFLLAVLPTDGDRPQLADRGFAAHGVEPARDEVLRAGREGVTRKEQAQRDQRQPDERVHVFLHRVRGPSSFIHRAR